LSNIRVTYSGLIAFVVGIIGVLTGLLFVLMITRRLSPEEFGTWALIGSIVNYFLISELIISFWSTRQIARGEKIGRTSLISAILFSLISIPLYLGYVTLISEGSTADYEILVFGVILIPVYFVSQTLVGVNLGHKPHATSYALLIFGVLKIPIALALVVYFEWGVKGAILAILLAYLSKIIIQIYFAKPQLSNKFSLHNLKRWLKLSWIPLYSTIPKYIQHIDVVLYTIIIGSVIGVAYYQASFTVAAIVVHSGLITRALYPKLLAQNEYGKIQDSLANLMYFSIPLVAIAIIFSKPALFALNPAYQEASIIVILLTLKLFFYVTKITPIAMLAGIEKVDTEHDPHFTKLLKSKLFSIQTILLIFYSVYLGVLISVLLVIGLTNTTELELVIWWALIGLIIEIPMSILFWFYAKKHLDFSFPFKSTVKYLGATIAFSVVFFFTSPSIIIYHESIYNFLPPLIFQLAICIGLYLSITYLVDKKTRKLFKAIIREIKTYKN